MTRLADTADDDSTMASQNQPDRVGKTRIKATCQGDNGVRFDVQHPPRHREGAISGDRSGRFVGHAGLDWASDRPAVMMATIIATALLNRIRRLLT